MVKKKMVTKLVFVRHGQSEKNVLQLHSHTVDKWPLTEKGRKHAATVAEKLEKMGRFDLILSSPVLRARQTAEIISAKLGLPIVFEDLLREYGYGYWNDQAKESLSKTDPLYKEYNKRQRGTEEHFNFKLGGEESRADIVERVREFIKKVTKEHPNKSIVLVSHGGINSAIAMVLDNVSLETFYERELIGHEEIEIYCINN